MAIAHELLQDAAQTALYVHCSLVPPPFSDTLETYKYLRVQSTLRTAADGCDFLLQYGQVVNLIIPRPNPTGGAPPSGLGKVIIEYPDADSAAKARMAMHNRRFAGRTVTAVYLNENSYAAGNLD